MYANDQENDAMRLIDEHSGLEMLSREECLRLLGAAAVGRLVVSGSGTPDIFPVNFELDGDRVVFRTAAGRKHADGPRGSVLFEVDGTYDAARSGWSVVVHGWLEEVEGEVGRSLADAMGVDPWAVGPKGHVMRLNPTTITGRRVGPD